MISLTAHYSALQGESPCGISKRTAAIFYGLIEITLLVCAVLTLAKAGAFSNIAEVHRINWITFGFGLLAIDLLYAGVKCCISTPQPRHHHEEKKSVPKVSLIHDNCGDGKPVPVVTGHKIDLKPLLPNATKSLQFDILPQRLHTHELAVGKMMFFHAEEAGTGKPKVVCCANVTGEPVDHECDARFPKNLLQKMESGQLTLQELQ